MTRTKEHIREALIPAFMTLVVFAGVLIAKGIFPFGGLRIDYYDMGQTNAPLYYHIWDFLHGRGGLFYSWYIDEGQNLAMGSSIQWNVSVFNLFFFFVTRNAVMKSLSIFMGIHLFFMAFNMDLFLKRVCDTPKFFRILFALSYGLTGFTLTHYTIPTYLDTAALMPLYLITLYDALKGREDVRVKGGTLRERIKDALKDPVARYALMTGYMTCLGYYMAFMNLIFVLLVSGTYVFVLCGAAPETDRDERRKMRGRAALRLGIGTFSGLGLSSFMLLPAAMQMMKSSRFNSNLSGSLSETLHDILWAIGADMYYIKWWLLSGSIAAIVITLCGLLHFRKEIRTTIFCFLFCMYPTALIVFESINLLWHMGTYYHYPIRCGYLIPTVLLTSGAYYAGRFEKERPASHADDRKWLIIAGVIAVTADAGLIYYYNFHGIWQIEELFRAWVIFAVILAVICFLLYFAAKRPVLLLPLLIMELALTSYVGYGQPHFTDRFSSDPEQSGDYVVTAQLLKDDLEIYESRTDRIKNPDTTLNTNYGFVMRRATVGGWANTVPRSQMDSAIALGYGAHFMRVLDAGGSLLSDAMLHVTETITVKPHLYSDLAWEEEGRCGDYTLLKNKFTLPFVMSVGQSATEGSAPLSSMGFADATNAAYGYLAPDDTEGIVKDVTDAVRDGSYHAGSQKALYLEGGEFESLKINGSLIPVPDIGDPEGTRYPAWFNSALLFLGIYEDQDIEADGADDPATRFYELDMKRLEDVCEKYSTGGEEEISTSSSGMDIRLSASSGEWGLIPMAYDEGFKAYVNGKKAEIRNVSDVFVAVPLEEGENQIRLKFTPSGLIPGILISLMFLAAVVFFAVYPVDISRAAGAGRILLAVLFGTFVTALYLIPYIAFIVHQIEKRLL